VYHSPAGRPLPPQAATVVMMHAERFRRSSTAMQAWAKVAREATRFLENDQWSEEDRARLEAQQRPALTINKIRPVMNLIMGYHLNNRTDICYLPGHDGTGSADMARVLTHVGTNIAEINRLTHKDLDLLQDGLTTGRAYQDWRVDFARNDFGEVRVENVDPFSVYLDPDADSNDLNDHSFVMQSKWLTLEEIEHWYGRRVFDLVVPLANGMTFSNSPASLIAGYDEVEITPWRRFGGEDSEDRNWIEQADYLFHDWIDRQRKQIRMLDIQHYILTTRQFFIDLETGDRKPVPDHWGQDRVAKVMLWAQEMGAPLTVEARPTRRLRMTQMIGDIVAYDAWSPYETMTMVGYFPYFRRGRTQGVVEHLIGVQKEINYNRSARTNAAGRIAAGGWMYDKDSLSAQGKANLSKHGASAGLNLEYDSKNGSLPRPEQIGIQNAQFPWEKLEKDAAEDLVSIAGINAAALGQVQSAAASGLRVLAEQRQAVVGLEVPLARYREMKDLAGRKQLELIQNWYTEQRVVRVLGINEMNPQSMIINEATAAGVINDVTIGRYAVLVDETPISKTYLEGQFRELLEMRGLGIMIPDDHIIDASSYGRKEELRLAVAAEKAQAAAMGVPPGEGAPAGPGPGGSALGVDGGSLPANGPPPQ
jgi:hypothetical protein